ncbi:ZIP family metal transporter [Halarchaeum sp. CBA1220]|uniref:ZIP family metal transporter n=1 Tax=Halarchaeum sp. CBA1220 TaxID=1853682 RepID=UPI000F3A7F63|nr:ZIP family metal transporter [Halarchaeum sp. CBA1220]QLC32829.1 ZIP family metal transporter [Halarchaeum sp. CBA1220]
MAQTTSLVYERRGETAVGLAAVALLVALSAYALAVGRAGKVVGIGWVAFAAMSFGTLFGVRADADAARGLVWGYGLASGAMVTSAAVFLVPQAVGYQPKLAGFGLAAGVLTGFAAHTIGHRLSHLDLPMDRTTAQITAHALSAGLIIGAVYAAMPELGAVLGLAIVSHKGPAGYAAARRLRLADRSVLPLLLPAAGVGIAAVAVGLLRIPADPAVDAVVFGFAAGVFLHVAMDFLPDCEVGGEIHDVVTRHEDGHDHDLLDRLRTQAVASTAVGALAVFAASVALGVV